MRVCASVRVCEFKNERRDLSDANLFRNFSRYVKGFVFSYFIFLYISYYCYYMALYGCVGEIKILFFLCYCTARILYNTRDEEF